MNVREDMFTDLNKVQENAWELLGQGVASRKHGFHHGYVATIGVSGLPRIRTVILRAANSSERTVRFHTDCRSQKCCDLQANPAVALVFYDEPGKIQVRIEGTANLHFDDEIADASWAAAQPLSKMTYGIMPKPGLAIEAHDLISMPQPKADVEWARKHFAVVQVQVQTLQWLYLKHDGQRCAVFDFSKGTRTWTVPS
jgi:pyridoxamine 5'-phosphate oxidase